MIIFLLVMYAMAVFGPPPPNNQMMLAASTLVLVPIVVLWANWIDRRLQHGAN